MGKAGHFDRPFFVDFCWSEFLFSATNQTSIYWPVANFFLQAPLRFSRKYTSDNFQLSYRTYEKSFLTFSRATPIKKARIVVEYSYSCMSAI